MLPPKLWVALAAGSAVLAVAAEKQFTPAQRRWWAFQKVRKPAVPPVKHRAWVRNDVDAFILAALEEKNLVPNPPAGKIALIRRASLDLTGLPPTPEEVQAFLADASPKAFDKVVDRLLASPRYGERWGRHWLDLARYADSEGFKSDETRPNIWRYRDYVIQSFNNDKPYDRFIREQIAGDELYPDSPEALVATGFNRHFPDESNARNLLQRRQEILNDITDTVGATFLGLTYGCARCHDHKFDPVLQKDYYRLQAFFANTRIEDKLALASSEERRAFEERYRAWDEKTRDLRAEIEMLVQPQQAKLYKENFDKFPPEIQEAVETPGEKRTPIQWHMYYKARTELEHSPEEAARLLKGKERGRYEELKNRLAAFDDIKPADLPLAQAMIDNGRDCPETHVLAVGVYNAPREAVEPGFLSILDPAPAMIVPPSGAASSGRRSALAQWLTSAENPLTARVMVNRIWHYHFGKGIVGTPSDFGVMGDRPTHPQLLDYLAAYFVENGWSIKKMHRLILLSAAYRQSSKSRPAAARADPENRLLWRFPRRRLEGEAIRDDMLFVSGLLNPKMGGPGVFPPLPPGVETRGGWKKAEDPQEANRRSVYIFVRRNLRYPMLEVFDLPDTHESCARRYSSVTPSQALTLMNDQQVFEWSRALAGRVLNDSGLAPEAEVERAYKLVYGRAPDARERQAALAFLDRHTRILAARQDGPPLPEPAPQGVEPARAAAFVDFCHVLMSSNEFLTVN